tara:strand:- start:333 stop:638 length:306 start_codon:yes stop_codon:yes gene_type:complete
MEDLKKQYPFVDDEVLEIISMKGKIIMENISGEITRELKILNSETEKRMIAEKKKEESVRKCESIQAQLDLALAELETLKKRLNERKQIPEQEHEDERYKD